MSVVVNSKEFNNGLDSFVKRFERQYRIGLRKLVTEAMKGLLAKTPVHTGETIKNYVATVGSPYSGAVKLAGDPIEATNHLSLGAEQLRSANASVSMATLFGINLSDPFVTIYITNKSPNVAGLEYGELPKPPYQPRSPKGMFRVTLQELSVYLANKGILQ